MINALAEDSKMACLLCNLVELVKLVKFDKFHYFKIEIQTNLNEICSGLRLSLVIASNWTKKMSKL